MFTCRAEKPTHMLAAGAAVAVVVATTRQEFSEDIFGKHILILISKHAETLSTTCSIVILASQIIAKNRIGIRKLLTTSKIQWRLVKRWVYGCTLIYLLTHRIMNGIIYKILRWYT